MRRRSSIFDRIKNCRPFRAKVATCCGNKLPLLEHFPESLKYLISSIFLEKSDSIWTTLQKLVVMKLHGMARAFRATMETAVKQFFTPDELISHLVDIKWDERHNRKLRWLIKAAKFRYHFAFEEIDPCSRLFKYLKLCIADGSYLNKLTLIGKQDLFVPDDLGPEPFDGQSRLSLLDILEDRVGRKSSIIVSQVPVDRWHEIIGHPTMADAICDRIAHSAHRIKLKGESVRKLNARREFEQEEESE